MLKECPLYAILSGFPVHDTPGVGTFYDFFHRLWKSDKNNVSPQERFSKKKVKKGKKKREKTPLDSTSMASKLLPYLVAHPIKPSNPFHLMFQLYHQQFLNVSINNGFINPNHLAIAGDGTPIRTSARGRNKRICKCKEEGIFDCHCKRHYSQPDCNWGWDSSHDAYPVYDYCKTHGIYSFIDMNKGNTGNFKYKNDVTIDSDGVPICKMGLRMKHDGMEKAKHRCKFRCPKANRKRGCYCQTPCSDSKYGRTVHT